MEKGQGFAQGGANAPKAHPQLRHCSLSSSSITYFYK